MSQRNGKKTVQILELAGSFAEDKDIAKRVRVEDVLPAIRTGKGIVLDFAGVSLATQSFIHAMISEPLHLHGAKALELIEFKSCNRTIKSVILTVVEYSLEAQKA